MFKAFGDAVRQADATPHSFIATQPDGLLIDILRYWSGLCRGSMLPARRDIDPAAIRLLLPYVFLVDVVGRPPRFRKRLVGTAIVAKEGYDSTGSWLDESVKPSIREAVLAQHCEAVEHARPNCYSASFIGLDGRTYRYQRLLLPLAGDGTTVDMLFGGVVFD